MNFKQGWGLGLVCALLVGCASTPFMPVAIPNYTSVKPMEVMDAPTLFTELTELQNEAEDLYRIAPNDIFSIQLVGQPELTRAGLRVTPDGLINALPIGLTKIAGLTLAEATVVLNDRYREFLRNPSVILEPLEVHGYNFTIAGTVTQPGVYTISIGYTRLTDAIAMARGFSTGLSRSETIVLADLDHAYIMRKGKVLPIDFDKAINYGDPLHNVPIKNGDYIFIPATIAGNITLLGEVNSPTYLAYQSGITVLQALGHARGVKETHSDEIKVIRGGLKNPEVFTLNLTAMFTGKAMDFALNPRDIVYVPRNRVSDWNVIMRDILPTIQVINGIVAPFNSSYTIYGPTPSQQIPVNIQGTP